METIIRRRWIGHVLRKDSGNIAHTTVRWTPEAQQRQTKEQLEANGGDEDSGQQLGHHTDVGPE